MTNTTHLGMPFIEGSQAQKHVTHNEALRILDAVIQIGVLDRDRISPPLTPADGDRHIVASGATGAWARQAKAVAIYEDGAWRFLNPKLGWCAWCDAEGALLVYDGAAWTDVASGGGGGSGGSESLARLGINAIASDPNLLTVKSNAALFSAIKVADGGTGDTRLQIAKEVSTNTASVVFSDAFSGHAEFGLVESNAFKLKVSDDGSAFVEALTIDPGSGNAAFPRGLALTGVISPPQITSNQNDYNPAGVASASMINLSSDASRSVSGLAGGAEGRVIGILNTGSQAITLLNESASSAAANRFALGSDVAIAAKQAALLRYDGAASRWYALARPVGRDVLSANRTYYVRTDGSNSNTGLSNSAGGAFLTIQKAIDVIAALDISIYSVTVQLGDGTYTAEVAVDGPFIGSGRVTINGNSSTPANVVVTSLNNTIFAKNGAKLTVANFEVRSSSVGLIAQTGGRITLGAGMRFGACTNYHMSAETGGTINYVNGAYSIVGAASSHVIATTGGIIQIAANTITITGNPAFSSAFAFAARSGVIENYSNTFSGTATGIRYTANTLGNIFVNSAGATYLPGNAAGSTATGGQYV